MFRALLFIFLVIGCASPANAEDPTANLDKAKKAYTEAVDAAKTALLDGFATAIKTVTASGNLDAVKTLSAEKESFEVSGRVPSSTRMKTATVAYQQAMKQATTTLEKAYDQTIKDLTKAMKFAEAEAIQTQMKEFRGKAPGTSLRPTDVTTKEDLKQYLAGSRWDLDGVLLLHPDGSVEQKKWFENGGIVCRWEALDRRTAILLIVKGREDNKTCTMTFSEDLMECSGYGFRGERLAVFKRKP